MDTEDNTWMVYVDDPEYAEGFLNNELFPEVVDAPAPAPAAAPAIEEGDIDKQQLSKSQHSLSSNVGTDSVLKFELDNLSEEKLPIESNVVSGFGNDSYHAGLQVSIDNGSEDNSDLPPPSINYSFDDEEGKYCALGSGMSNDNGQYNDDRNEYDIPTQPFRLELEPTQIFRPPKPPITFRFKRITKSLPELQTTVIREWITIGRHPELNDVVVERTDLGVTRGPHIGFKLDSNDAVIVKSNKNIYINSLHYPNGVDCYELQVNDMIGLGNEVEFADDGCVFQLFCDENGSGNGDGVNANAMSPVNTEVEQYQLRRIDSIPEENYAIRIPIGTFTIGRDPLLNDLSVNEWYVWEYSHIKFHLSGANRLTFSSNCEIFLNREILSNGVENRQLYAGDEISFVDERNVAGIKFEIGAITIRRTATVTTQGESHINDAYRLNSIHLPSSSIRQRERGAAAAAAAAAAGGTSPVKYRRESKQRQEEYLPVPAANTNRYEADEAPHNKRKASDIIAERVPKKKKKKEKRLHMAKVVINEFKHSNFLSEEFSECRYSVNCKRLGNNSGPNMDTRNKHTVSIADHKAKYLDQSQPIANTEIDTENGIVILVQCPICVYEVTTNDTNHMRVHKRNGSREPQWDHLAYLQYEQTSKRVNNIKGTFVTAKILFEQRLTGGIFEALQLCLKNDKLLEMHSHRWVPQQSANEPQIGTYRMYLYVHYYSLKGYLGICKNLMSSRNHKHINNSQSFAYILKEGSYFLCVIGSLTNDVQDANSKIYKSIMELFEKVAIKFLDKQKRYIQLTNVQHTK